MYEQKRFGQIICLLCAAVLMICSFAKTVSTRVFYMDEGIIYEDGTPEEIFLSILITETVLRQKLSKRDFNKIADCTFCV